MLLWWVADDPALPQAARAAISSVDAEVYVSPISLAEISIKQSRGKLVVDGDLSGAIEESDFRSLPFSAEHGCRLATLPWHHRDPFDRMLMAQALAESLVFATLDRACLLYDVPTLN